KIEETTKENLVGSVKSMSPNNTGTGTITVNADGSVTNKADSGKVLSLYKTFNVTSSLTQPPEIGKRYLVSMEAKADIPSEFDMYFSKKVPGQTTRFNLTKEYKQVYLECDYLEKNLDALIVANDLGTTGNSITYRNLVVSEVKNPTPAGYNYAYYTMAYLPKGKYDIYYKAKIDILEGNPDMLTIVDYPNTVSIIDPK